ncbi:branched-chain amino acid ABC transporter permease [Halobacteriales archaeon Cl-PHB]
MAVFGLIRGGIIAVGAVGMTLSYGVTRFINFAYGEFLTYGMYITLFLTAAGVGMSLPLPVAALIAILLVGVMGVAIARLFFDPLADRGAIPLLITSLGVGFFVRYTLVAFAGVQTVQLPLPLMRGVEVFGVRATPIEIGVVAIAAIAMVLIHLILTKTLLGQKMRATSGNENLAEIAGIDTDGIITKTWFISAAAGGLAGILYALMFYPVRPFFGFHFLIFILTAVILGGIGKPYGAMLAGVGLGLATEFGVTYIASGYSTTYAFILLVAVLLYKPEGIAGGEF